MKKKILIVDDKEFNRDFLEIALQGLYEIDKAENGVKALYMISNNEYACILLDIKMPQLSGIDVMKELNKKNILERTPVIIITGENTTEMENECLELGALDFIPKPFNIKILQKRVSHIVDLYELQNQLKEKVAEQTKVLQEQNHELEVQACKLKKKTKLLSDANNHIINVLGTIVEYRDMESGEHVERVAAYTEVLARCAMKHFPEYGLTEKMISIIRNTSPLHDLGKIAIPDHILMKPGRLTADEFEIMKEHTSRGYDMLQQIKGFWSMQYRNICYNICHYHHERYDGNGYPEHLKGEEIPICAQLVSIADVYDALINKRVYKEAYSLETAFNMIMNGECGIFSPKLLECLKIVRPDFEAIAKSDASYTSEYLPQGIGNLQQNSCQIHKRILAKIARQNTVKIMTN